ncbi:2OG-Fe(II) oxygenase [bacterium]|nr:2OG-Fe(II) oxygenase [bacterium]MCI0602921.1 2OG-Fe(II) oxygenase [bacterium]
MAQNRTIDWDQVEKDLDEKGYAVTAPVLNPEECGKLISLYSDDQRFRSRIVMERFQFGSGEYKYFSNPLPEIVQKLRTNLYSRLAKIATRWKQLLGETTVYPETLKEYLDTCHRKGQTKPTPLMLKYQSGGYNCLHQDLYGEMVFPLQCTIFLTATTGYKGGEFLLVEQRPRAQSRGEATVCEQGEMIIFPVRDRPVRGTRGYYRTNMRHGVSTIRSGERFTLGIIFHDAK